jgi:hypothetical protein
MRPMQWFGLLAGIALLAGLAAAPVVSPIVIAAAGWLWLLLMVVMIAVTARLVRRRYGATATFLAVAGLLVAPIAITAVDWKGSLGIRMPCRRNWAWLPSYLPRSSPIRDLRFRVDDTEVKICYGSPRARGRRMLGGSPVPYGRLWRTGANEPTTIRTTGPITIAGITIPHGNASLYTIPGPETWEIILNRSTRQWGLEREYTESIKAAELGRTLVPSRTTVTHVEALEIEAEPDRTGAREIVIRWETTAIRLPVTTARP